jgi:hypothetical protein
MRGLLKLAGHIVTANLTVTRGTGKTEQLVLCCRSSLG